MDENNIVWINGSDGFVGSIACKYFEEAGYQVVGTDSTLSVCEPERLYAFAEELQPQVVVNAAGIRRSATTLSTRVKAYEVNALGARNLALAANSVGATIVQISSDDVYSSKVTEPVNEFDPPRPDTPYGKSKRAGEQMVRSTTPEHIIVRSSWLYSPHGGNMQAILKTAAEGGKYIARTDQYAAPTSLATYMTFLIEAVKHEVHGTFHIATKGRANRYDFAARILKIAGYNPDEILVPEEDPKTSENVVLESLMLEMFGHELPTWEEDLRTCMEREGLVGIATK